MLQQQQQHVVLTSRANLLLNLYLHFRLLIAPIFKLPPDQSFLRILCAIAEEVDKHQEH